MTPFRLRYASLLGLLLARGLRARPLPMNSHFDYHHPHNYDVQERWGAHTPTTSSNDFQSSASANFYQPELAHHNAQLADFASPPKEHYDLYALENDPYEDYDVWHADSPLHHLHSPSLTVPSVSENGPSEVHGEREPSTFTPDEDEEEEEEEEEEDKTVGAEEEEQEQEQAVEEEEATEEQQVNPSVRKTKKPSAETGEEKEDRKAAFRLYAQLMQGSGKCSNALYKRFQRHAKKETVQDLLSGIHTRMYSAMMSLDPKVVGQAKSKRTEELRKERMAMMRASKRGKQTTVTEIPDRPSFGKARILEDTDRYSDWALNHTTADRGNVLKQIILLVKIPEGAPGKRAREIWRKRVYRHSTAENVTGLYSADPQAVHDALHSLSNILPSHDDCD